MRVNDTKMIDCSGIMSAECSDLFLAALGNGIGFRLRADNPTDTVHGAVTIVHNFPPIAHEILVEVYEQQEGPNARHRSTLNRPLLMPTTQDIRNRLALR